MKRYTSILKQSFLALSSLGLFLAPNNAWAGSSLIYDSTTSDCTTTNCNAVVLNGVLNRNNFNQAEPFSIPLYSNGNECMRIDVTRQMQDLEAVLVSPSGTVWRDDDGSGNQRTLIKANTDVAGWYTLQISYYNGQSPIALQ